MAEPEHETTLAYTKKIEVGKDIILSPALCNFQVHLQQITACSASSSDDASSKSNDIYNLILIPKTGYQSGREFVVATFDSEMANQNRSIPIDLLVSVTKPNEQMKNGQSFILRLVKKGDKQQQNGSDAVYGVLGGLQITSFTAAQFLALKATKKKKMEMQKQQQQQQS